MDVNEKNNISVSKFAKTYLKETLFLDKRIVNTIQKLLFRPGYLTEAFLKNDNNEYAHPLRLYFIVNLLFFLLIPLLNNENIRIFSFNLDNFINSIDAYKNIVEAQIQSIGIPIEIYKERFNASLKYNQPAFVFLIVPFYAIILKLCFIRRKSFFVTHLIYSTHFLTFFLLYMLFIVSAYRLSLFIFSSLTGITGLLGTLLLISLLVILPLYLFLSLKRFYKTSFTISTIGSIILFAAFILALSIYAHILFFYTFLAIKLGA